MANTYLTRQISNAGSRKKATISLWVKRGSGFGNDQRFFSYENTSVSNNVTVFKFSGDSIQFADQTGGSNNARYDGTRKLRDSNAWYHFLVKMDTTQATNTDRLKIYINGELQSEASYTYPTQNADLNIGHNANAYIDIGRWRGSNNQYFDGAITHFHYTDGYAYDASTFGETDATTGEWKIKTSPSVTYGTNGFFILKDNNGVTDQSGQSNNYTVGGGTLTSLQDNPSNVFATINTLQGAIASGYTVANGNLGITGNTGSAWRSLPATLSASSGKFYWEVKITGFSTGMHFGVQDVEQAVQTNAYAYQYSRAYMYKDDGGIANNGNVTSYGNSWTTNDIVGVALDMDNSKIYFSKNGVWQNSGDPTSGATGTGSAYTLASGYTYTPMFSTNASADTFQYNFGNGIFGTTAISSEGTNASGIGKFEYDVPAGFTALSTKGLNL